MPFPSNFHINSCMYTQVLAFLSACGGNRGLILLLLLLSGNSTGIIQCGKNSQSLMCCYSENLVVFDMNCICLSIIVFQEILDIDSVLGMTVFSWDIHMCLYLFLRPCLKKLPKKPIPPNPKEESNPTTWSWFTCSLYWLELILVKIWFQTIASIFVNKLLC